MITLIRSRALRGPNLWARQTLIEAHIRVTDRELPCTPAELETRLLARLPQMAPMLMAASAEGPLTLPLYLAATATALQAVAGCSVSFFRVFNLPEADEFLAISEYSEEAVGRLATDQAIMLMTSALQDETFAVDAALAELRELDEDIRLGPSTGAIVSAAVAQGIPFKRLTTGSLVQLGWGSRQRFIQAAETSHTSAIGESIAQDKDLTKHLLQSIGLSVPRGTIVTELDDAIRAAHEIGMPVVIKPRDGNQGKGVAVNISHEDQIPAAFEAAQRIGHRVIIESFLPGHDFRLLVVGQELVAAARRDPPHVIGDGEKTIRELVEIVNSDPLRGDGHATSLSKVRLDAIGLATLEEQGVTPDSIPSLGQRINLRKNANLSTGGSATDVTDEVHPDLAAMAVAAANMIGLDIAGIDVVAETVQRTLADQGGGIVEVNAAPGLRMHLAPSYGKPRPIGEKILRTLFAPDDDARIPVVAVTGTNGKTTTVRLTAHLLRQQGLRVGMTTTDGVYIDQRRLDTGDCSGPISARNVLSHPDADAAVLETARGGILREGLGFDRCQVAVVTNLGEGDHLGMGIVHTTADLALVKRVVVQNVAPNGMAVLNGADPHVLKMAAHCPGGVTFFAGQEVAKPMMLRHKAKGHRVLYREGREIIAAEGKRAFHLQLDDIPLVQAPGAPAGTEPLGFQVENVMAAVGAAWALEVPWPQILQGLQSFDSSPETAPGRFNRMSYRGATVIADYGHNLDAIKALMEALELIPAERRHLVISAAGDRRDEDIRSQTRLAAPLMDRVVLYEDACQRGREDGETFALLKDGLAQGGFDGSLEEIRGEFAAIDLALGGLLPGDLCLILVDQVEEAVAYLQTRCDA